jgi:hypothetical protein
MRFSVTFGTGYSLGPWRRNMFDRLERGALRATDRASIGARDDTRRVMRGQRLGNLANAIKQTSDLKKGRIKRLPGGGFSASGIVFAHIRSERTKGALEAYTEGSTIVPRKGRWMWIATNEIPRLVGRYRMTPERYDAAGYDRRIGPLKFVQTGKASVAYLVVDEVTTNKHRTGSAKRAPKNPRKSKRQHVGIVAFVGIKKTRRFARFSPREIGRKWQGRLARFWSEEVAGTGGKR